MVEPITIWTQTRAFHLTLDGAAPRSVQQPLVVSQPEEEEEEDVDEEEEQAVAATVSPVGLLLAQVEAKLLAIAEGGVEVMRDVSPLRDAARECRALGLAGCGRALAELAERLDRFRKSIERDARHPAEQLLRAAYVVRLAVECATVCAAVPA